MVIKDRSLSLVCMDGFQVAVRKGGDRQGRVCMEGFQVAMSVEDITKSIFTLINEMECF